MTVKVDGTKGLIQNYDYLVPTTGFSYTFTTANGVILNPAATLATGTVVMPAAPVDGMTITISTTKEISAFTLSGSTGQTVSNAPTALLAGDCITFLYRSANTTWFPFSDVSAAPGGLGVNQTWQSLTGSRSFSTTYTNSTGLPITVVVAASSTGGAGGLGGLNATVGGVTFIIAQGRDTGLSQGYPAMAGTFIVPTGSTYSVATTGITNTLDSWAELR